MIVNLSDQSSIAHQFIGELRDSDFQKDKFKFRKNLERLGEIFAYEISKTLTYEDEDVETPLGVSSIKSQTEPIVLSAILRAGLPLHQGLLNYFEYAENAFVSAYRSHHKDGSFEVRLEYMTSPPLDGKTLIIADPMLATGSSVESTIKALCKNGDPKNIHLVTVIAARNGINHIRRIFPKVRIWVGAIDEELTAKSYIVPGLGDAGDLCYGSKRLS